ncbi:MAG: siphovirus Gp157 family protein [Chlorobi bacterium]|nr:siphovirus Gp157 family protein [Chlorobiota bacterium]
MKLYEIADNLAELEEYVSTCEGRIDPAILGGLIAVEESLTAKVEGVCKVILSMERNAEAAKAESERLARLAKNRSESARGLRNYLTHHLERLGKRRVDTPTLTATVAAKPAKVVLLALPDTLPERFQRVPEPLPIEADKVALLEAYEAGEGLPDGVAIEQGYSLRIR